MFLAKPRTQVSGRTGVVRSCGQVEAVGVVVEHQQTVEVLPSSQEAVLAIPPGNRTVSETVDRQGHPGFQVRLLQVTPAVQVSHILLITFFK